MVDYQQMQQNVQDVINSKRMDSNMGTDVVGDGMKYKILNTHHPEYDPLCAHKLELMFQGGKHILQGAKLFLPKAINESPVVYKERLGYASYHNHLAEITNNYLCDLFSKSLAVLPAADADDEETKGEMPQAPEFYQEFSKDADLAEHSFEQVLKDVAEKGLVQGVGYVGLDFPNPEEMDQAFLDKEMEEISLADEEQFKLSRAYLYQIPYESVIDWQMDDYDKFKWCVLRNDSINRNSFKEGRNTKTVKFKVWFFNDAGDVCYECYERTYKLDETPKDDDTIPLVDEGIVSFKRIPIKALCIPDGLWIGNQLYPILLENFKLRSMINFSESRAANEIPFYQQAAEEMMNPVSEKEDRGSNFRSELVNKGFLVGTANDKLSFVGPKGDIFKVLHEQLKDNVNEMHRIHHMMASTIASKGTSSSSSRSGVAKQKDEDSKSKVLSQLALLIKDFAKEIYDDIADGRNEDIMWQCIGMTDFESLDKDDLLKEAQASQQINQLIPSKTFQKMQLTQLAFKLIPDVNPETMFIIKKEIDDSLMTMQPMVNGQPQPGQPGQPTQPGINSPGGSDTNPKPSNPSSNPSSNAGTDETGADMPVVDETGNMPGYDGMHLSDNEHIDPQVVYDILAEDYQEKDIQFVLSIAWTGPYSVPLTSIDFSNKDQWAAADDMDHVDEFVEKIGEGWNKPIILVDERHHNGKMVILDGHHRALAYLQLGKPIPAYVGEIGKISDEMKKMHSRQAGSKQMSNQMASNQKAVSNQVSKSENAVGGKTK